MSVNTARSQIYTSLKDLRILWQQTQEQWNDVVAHEFEELFWNPLEGATITAVGALDRLEQILLQVRRECGGHGMSAYGENASE